MGVVTPAILYLPSQDQHWYVPMMGLHQLATICMCCQVCVLTLQPYLQHNANFQLTHKGQLQKIQFTAAVTNKAAQLEICMAGCSICKQAQYFINLRLNVSICCPQFLRSTNNNYWVTYKSMIKLYLVTPKVLRTPNSEPPSPKSAIKKTNSPKNKHCNPSKPLITYYIVKYKNYTLYGVQPKMSNFLSLSGMWQKHFLLFRN